MRLIITAILLFSIQAHGVDFTPAVIYDADGNTVKALRTNINLNDAAAIKTGTDNPSTTAVSAPRGSIYLRTGASGGSAFMKQDTGLSTNWTALGGGGAGSVTSVGLSLPGIFSVTNSPVTGSGTLTGTLVGQIANSVFAGPAAGANAPPTFRSLVALDIPALAYISGLTGDVTASGSGSVAATVVKIRGVTVSATSPTNGQVLSFNSGTSQWEPHTSSSTPGGSNTAVQFNSSGTFGGDAANFSWDSTNKYLGIGTGSPATGLDVISPLADAAYVRRDATTGSGTFVVRVYKTSEGPLGVSSIGVQGKLGNLSGTSPLFFQPDGGAIYLGGLLWPSSDGSSGQLLQTDGAGTLSFVSPSAITALSGDVTTTGSGVAAATVVRIQGQALSVTTPMADQVLTWNGTSTEWEPRDATGGGGGADVHLSNLVATTVNDHIVPGVDNVVNLGAGSLGYANAWINNIQTSLFSNMLISTQQRTGTTTGSITIQPGNSIGGSTVGANAVVNAGTGRGLGGTLSLSSGISFNNDSGPVQIKSADFDGGTPGTRNTGAITIKSGTSTTRSGTVTGGQTGNLNLSSGDAKDAGVSGSVNISTGASVNGNSGNINLSPAVPSGSGTRGVIQLLDHTLVDGFIKNVDNENVIDVPNRALWTQSVKVLDWASAKATIYGDGTGSASLQLNRFPNDFSTTLSVADSLGSDTTFKFPPDNGTNGYFLSSDGSGGTSWVAGGSPAGFDFSTSTFDSTINTPAGGFDTTKNLNLRTGDSALSTSGSLLLLTGTSATNSNTGTFSVLTSSATGSGSSGYVTLLAGSTDSGVAGYAQLRAGDTNTGFPGVVNIIGGNASGGTNPGGDINITSGDAAGADSGSILIEVGNVMSGTKGKIKLLNGTQGTPGDVWTSTDAFGSGAWVTPSGGGVPSPGQISNSYTPESNGLSPVMAYLSVSDNDQTNLASFFGSTDTNIPGNYTSWAYLESGSITAAASSGQSGTVWIRSGDVVDSASTGKTGDINLLTGTQQGTNDSGILYLQTGNATTGASGNIVVHPGSGGSAQGQILFNGNMQLNGLVNSHIVFAGTAPTVTANCGTSPSVVGNDVAGIITVGGGGADANCQLTFHTPWGNPPVCQVSTDTDQLTFIIAPTTTTVDFTGALALTAGSKLAYHCVGY